MMNVALTTESPTARQFATGVVRGTPLFDAIRERGGDVDAISAALEHALQRECGDHPMRAPMRAIVVEAR